jgi:hypothetical protein
MSPTRWLRSPSWYFRPTLWAIAAPFCAPRLILFAAEPLEHSAIGSAAPEAIDNPAIASESQHVEAGR